MWRRALNCVTEQGVLCSLTLLSHAIISYKLTEIWVKSGSQNTGYHQRIIVVAVDFTSALHTLFPLLIPENRTYGACCI